MKAIKVIKDDNNVFETHILGDVAVPASLADYEFPGFSCYFMTIRLDEYPFLNKNEGYLYIFFDLLGYFSEEYGEYSLVPMAYYSNVEPSIIFDDINEANKDEFKGFENMYMLDDGEGITIDGNIIRFTDKNLIDFFSNFDNDIKAVRLEFNNPLKENGFSEGVFKIEK